MLSAVAKTKRPTAESCPINQAFNDLTYASFAVWIRLHTVPRPDLKEGCRALAKQLDMDHVTLNRRLEELRNKGYVQLRLPQTSFESTQISLLKAAVVTRLMEFKRI